MKIRCEYCGTKNLSDNDSCWRCGGNLPETESLNLTDPEKPVTIPDPENFGREIELDQVFDRWADGGAPIYQSPNAFWGENVFVELPETKKDETDCMSTLIGMGLGLLFTWGMLELIDFFIKLFPGGN